MKEYFNFIPSETVRDLAILMKPQLSDRELAALIFYSERSLEEIHLALEELASETADQALKQEIQECVSYARQCLERIEANEDGSCLYKVVVENVDRPKTDAGVFATYQSALQSIKGKGKAFTIQKIKPISEGATSNNTMGWVSFDLEGDLREYFSAEIPHTDALSGPLRFKNCFIPLPNPFGRGDIVRDSSGRIGIVASSQEEWHDLLSQAEQRRGTVMFFDITLEVEFISEEGDWFVDFVPLMYLEAAKLDEDTPQNELLRRQAACYKEEEA